MRNKTTEVTEDTERGCLESQNMSTNKLLLFRLIMRGSKDHADTVYFSMDRFSLRARALREHVGKRWIAGLLA
jgi:collagenase-like PrtC family protease